MKWFEIPMVVLSLVSLGLVAGPSLPSAHADFVFGQRMDLKVGIPFLNSLDGSDCWSCNGLEMYIESDRLGGSGDYDLWVLRRPAPDAAWGPPEDLGPVVNSPGIDNAAAISADGLTLYFQSDRSGWDWDLYMTSRVSRSLPWGPAVKLGSTLNTAASEYCPWISADGLELYFTSNRAGGYGDGDLWAARRATVNSPWGSPINLGPALNTPVEEAWPSLTPDGLVLFFTSARAGGYGQSDVCMARRATTADAWGPPVNLGPAINSAAREQAPRMSPDGGCLCFWVFSDSRHNWQVPLERIVDFNGNGAVDSTDMAILADCWGYNRSVCDIGPFAWGDGAVDEKDLKIVMEALMTPGPRATHVPCGAVLSWEAPAFARTYDVYLGTSSEAVHTASRTHPQGVLVSQGQPATTHQLRGPLEFSQTYYWRIDVIVDPAETTIYQGPVLQFTTEAYAHPIQNVIATASSFQRGMGPHKTVDGAGLGPSDAHSADKSDMWLSLNVPPNWIQYEFGRVCTLYELWVWNFNEAIEPSMGFGAKTVRIEYSRDGTTWAALANVPEFARAPGKPGCPPTTKISFGGVSAKFVKLTIEKNWGVAPQTGLSEVRFFCIQNASAPQP